MASLRISPRYADRSFVYRTSTAAYEADFYNQFLIAPDSMIGEELRKGLAASELFKYVVGPSNRCNRIMSWKDRSTRFTATFVTRAGQRQC